MCTGVKVSGSVLQYKLEEAFDEMLFVHARSILVDSDDEPLPFWARMIPEPLRNELLIVINRFIQIRLKKQGSAIKTWWHPDEDVKDDALPHLLWITGYELDQLSEHKSFEDDATWVYDSTGYPLAPGDVPAPTVMDKPRIPRDPTNYGGPDILNAYEKSYKTYCDYWDTNPNYKEDDIGIPHAILDAFEDPLLDPMEE